MKRTELAEFLATMKKMGILCVAHQCSEFDSKQHDQNDKTITASELAWCVSISQAHFYFDSDEKFSCVKDDEMGNLQLRCR
jgi:hypothetical protein